MIGFSINGYEWAVQFVPPNSPYLLMENGYTVGCTDLRTQTVYLSDELDGVFLYAVLSHEICHAMIYSYGYDMSISEEECFCQILENHGVEVDRIADSLYPIIKQTP